MVYETDKSSSVLAIIQNSSLSNQEAETIHPDVLDQITTLICNKFNGDPQKLFDKPLYTTSMSDGTWTARSCMIRLFYTCGISIPKLSSLFGLQESVIRNYGIDFNNLRQDDQLINDETKDLEKNLPLVSEILDTGKSTEQIRKMVTFYFDVTWEEILGDSSKPDIASARALFSYLLNESGIPVTTISSDLEKKRSVINMGIFRIKNRLKTKDKFLTAVGIMKDHIRAIKAREMLENVIDERIKIKENQGTTTEAYPQTPSPL